MAHWERIGQENRRRVLSPKWRRVVGDVAVWIAVGFLWSLIIVAAARFF